MSWGQSSEVSRRTAHKLYDCVVPHPTAVEETCRHKKSRAYPVLQQNWQGDLRIVRVPIVERNACRARWEFPAIKGSHRIRERNDVETVRKLLDVFIETRGIAFIREQRVRLTRHAVIYQY